MCFCWPGCILITSNIIRVVVADSKIIAPRSSSELSVKIKVEVGDGEPIESALRRFKREVNKSGHLMELRHRRTFENSQDRKKRKIKEARMRKKFERLQRRRMQQNSQ